MSKNETLHDRIEKARNALLSVKGVYLAYNETQKAYAMDEHLIFLEHLRDNTPSS